MEKEENMKGKYRYTIDIVGSNDITVSEIFNQIPLGTLKEDKNGRIHEIKFPLVSHNGRHVIKQNIGHDCGTMYYDDLPVSKVIVSEFEYRIFLRKGKKDGERKHNGCTTGREKATA